VLNNKYRFFVASLLIIVACLSIFGCNVNSDGDMIDGSTIPSNTQGALNDPSKPECDHKWNEPSCVLPMYCRLCGVTDGDPLGHSDSDRDGYCERCGESLPNFDNPESFSELLAAFEFGDKGASVNYNGKGPYINYSEENGGYLLNIYGAENLYINASDALGNSCIKLGTDTKTKTGVISFDVPTDVSCVVIYISAYKDKECDIIVNDILYSISTSSNDGNYTAIIVDTSAIKTLILRTLEGRQRAFIDRIEFYK